MMRLIKSTRNLLLFFLVSNLSFAVHRLVLAQEASDVLYFPETGHTIRGDLLTFYNNAQDPLLVFGYPITETMTSRDGRVVQYFQRTRFELAADSLGVQHVQLTPIGQALYKPGEIQSVNNLQACQYFQSTGFFVCLQFLDFYRANGGVEQFGKPISPSGYQNGVLVQYFENARFEWRTDGFQGRVVPSALGRIYFDLLGEDVVQLNPVKPKNAAINPVLAIKVRAFVSKPVTRTSGDQTIFIIVRSQTGQAIANAVGIMRIRFPDRSVQSIQFTTDAQGLAQASFSFSNQIAGEMIPIEITVVYQNLTGVTQTSFRFWH